MKFLELMNSQLDFWEKFRVFKEKIWDLVKIQILEGKLLIFMNF